MLKLLDSLVVHRLAEAPKKVELYRGDLTALEPQEAVDVLVVSAFRGLYQPTASSLIGALLRNRRISVAALAGEKAVDLTDYFSCWLSQDLTEKHPGCGFKRILCFEPHSDASEVVGHLFQALAPFLGGKQRFSKVALPLIATGALGASVRQILPALLSEAVNWMSLGFPLNVLKVVAYDQSALSGEAAAVFAQVKKQHSCWDVFISYSHQDGSEAHLVYEELTRRNLRVFRDAKTLVTGSAWWEELRTAVKSSGYFVPLYSADYLRSDTCMSEFSIALASGKPILFPICLCGVADLPPMMTHTHMQLCTKGDGERLRSICQEFSQLLAQ